MHDVCGLDGLLSSMGEGGSTRRGMETNRGGRKQVMINLKIKAEKGRTVITYNQLLHKYRKIIKKGKL